MPRICHLVRQYHPSTGGLENFVASLSAEQIRLGAECEIVTLNRVFQQNGPKLAVEEWVGGVRVRRVPMIGARRFFVPVLPTGLLEGFDVIHVHGIDGLFEAVARRRRSPEQIYIATTHGAIFHTKWLTPIKRAYFDMICRRVAGRYDLILANSASDAALFQGLDVAVDMLPNGVRPLGDFCAEGPDILTVGRLARHKRVDRLIDALAAPPLKTLTSRLHIVGPAWDVSAHELKTHAAARGVGDRVIIHGRVDDARLQQIARECGVFVSASEYEGFGMTLIEAMSVGLSPVVEANNSFAELLGETKLGALVRYEHVDAAACAVANALDQTSVSDRAKIRSFAAKFSWDAHARATLAGYEIAAVARAAQRPAAA